MATRKTTTAPADSMRTGKRKTRASRLFGSDGSKSVDCPRL
jgi:hypothetical protein